MILLLLLLILLLLMMTKVKIESVFLAIYLYILQQVRLLHVCVYTFFCIIRYTIKITGINNNNTWVMIKINGTSCHPKCKHFQRSCVQFSSVHAGFTTIFSFITHLSVWVWVCIVYMFLRAHLQPASYRFPSIAWHIVISFTHLSQSISVNPMYRYTKFIYFRHNDSIYHRANPSTTMLMSY